MVLPAYKAEKTFPNNKESIVIYPVIYLNYGEVVLRSTFMEMNLVSLKFCALVPEDFDFNLLVQSYNIKYNRKFNSSPQIASANFFCGYQNSIFDQTNLRERANEFIAGGILRQFLFIGGDCATTAQDVITQNVRLEHELKQPKLSKF